MTLLLVLTVTALVIFVATTVFGQLTRLLRPIAAVIPWPQRGGEPIPNTATGADPGSPDPASNPDVPETMLLHILGFATRRAITDAVFEGGSVKAIGWIGAVKVFEGHGLVPRYVAGTSGRAIIAAALAVGGVSRDMVPIISSGDLTKYLDSRLLPQPGSPSPLALRPQSHARDRGGHYGAVRGDEFLDMIRGELRAMYNASSTRTRDVGPTDDVTFAPSPSPCLTRRSNNRSVFASSPRTSLAAKHSNFPRI